MKRVSIFFGILFLAAASFAQGYQVGDEATDFRLLNVDGKYVSMADFPDAKGFIVIFSCNHCPYVVAYEDRMIELHNKFAPKGYPVIAINPNDPEVQPQDSYELMQVRAKEKGFTFPYLFDDGQKIYPQYGATRTPHVYLLERVGKDLKVAYIGAIDDNYQDATQVKEKYLANAINSLMAGNRPEPNFTRAIGCTIKKK
jgi:peroxiredoxin